MARKLPWATISEASTTPGRQKPAAKRPKREFSASPSSNDGGTPMTPKGPAQSKLKFEVTPKEHRASRSPSTSPIRAPPTAGPMRPGYEADDIYIMVEDELQAVAQTFTHHLHAAEYKRLKKKAREAPPRTLDMLPRLSPNAPKEVKRKFEVMALQDRQQNVVAEDVEAKSRDPWLGTSLAGLMGSSSQPKRALVGNQEIQSSTRAASGFGRGEGESPSKKTKTGDLEATLDPEPQKPEKILSDRRNRKESTVLQDSVLSPAETNISSSRPSPSVEAPATRSPAPNPRITHTRPKSAARPPRKKFSFDDDFDIDAISSSAPDENPTSTAKRKVKTDVKEESKKTKLNDIPMFLV